MATQAAAGAAALQKSDFALAVQEYTAAIAQLPSAPQYYIARSTASLRLTPPDLSSAIHDAEYAVVLAIKRANKELIVQAQFRRGIALFRAGRIKEASQAFELVRTKGGGWVSGNKEAPAGGNYGKPGIKGITGLELWEAKCQNALAGQKAGDGDDREFVEVPDVKAPTSKGKEKEASKSASTSTAASTSTPKPSQPTPPAPATQTVRHDWYQTPNSIVLSLMAKGIPKDTCTVSIEPQCLHISWPLPANQTSQDSNYTYALDPLAHTIDPDQSSFKVFSTKLEITLSKADKGVKWRGLQEDGAAPVTNSGVTTSSTTSTDKPPAYPTSSRTGPKNWDTLISTKKDASAESETKDSSSSPSANKPEGTEKEDDPLALTEAELDDTASAADPASAFFQKLYAGADPDTRRAMMKSFQESNGTALSTNWSEVGKKKVETTPPDGMVAKEWEH